MKLVRKILTIFFWIGFISIWVVLTAFVNNTHHKIVYNSLEIKFTKDNEHQLIKKSDVVEIIKDLGLVQGVTLNKEINTRELEKKLNTHFALENAEVYFLNTGELNVNLNKRTPIARLIANDPSDNAYIDEHGLLMRTSDYYVAKLTLFSGEFKWSDSNLVSNVNGSLLSKIYNMSRIINNDPFLKSQIVQIHINNNGYFELIPRICNHKILFGSSDNMEKKFKKIKLFYTAGPSPKELNLYDTLNVMFNDQIVCSKIN